MRTLVLNASYEPLGIVSTRRAVILLLTGKAAALASSGARLRSQMMVVDAPSVILLNHYVRIPYRRIPLTRASALAHYRKTCAYCGKYGDTLDHVVPRARGGQHCWENVVVACFRCNNKKSDHLLAELGWSLPFVPREPQLSVAMMIHRRADDPAWAPYTNGWSERETKLAG